MSRGMHPSRRTCSFGGTSGTEEGQKDYWAHRGSDNCRCVVPVTGLHEVGERAVEEGCPVDGVAGSPGRAEGARVPRRSTAASAPAFSPHSAASRSRSQEAKRRAEPTRRDCHGYGAIAVHRREDEGGVGAVVCTVDPHSGRLGVVVDRAVDVGPGPWRSPRAGTERHRRRRTARRSTASRRSTSASISGAERRGDHGHDRAAVEEGAGLAGRHRVRPRRRDRRAR